MILLTVVEYFLVPFLATRRHWQHLQMILLCKRDQYGHLDTLNVKICPLFQILLTEQDVARSLVPILATKETLAPLTNDPIMWKRLIESFRHLGCQNLSIISDYID